MTYDDLWLAPLHHGIDGFCISEYGNFVAFGHSESWGIYRIDIESAVAQIVDVRLPSSTITFPAMDEQYLFARSFPVVISDVVLGGGHFMLIGTLDEL